MLTFFEAVFLSNCPLICSHSKSHPSPMTGGLPPPRCSPTEASILPAMLPASQNPTPTYLIAPLLFQQHNTVPRKPIHHKWQHKIKKIAKGTTGTKALLSTLTHSTPSVQSRSFNKLWNLGQSSAWLYFVKGEKYIGELWQIHATTERNSCINFGKSI